MARHTFGGDVASMAVSVGTNKSLSANNGVAVTFADAQTGGSSVTDLLAADGVTPITSVTTASDGTLPVFYGPSGTTQLWAIVPGAASRRLMLATDFVTSSAATYAAQSHLPINVLDAPYNVDNTGVNDAGPGILQAIQDAWNHSPTPRGVYVPAGKYHIATPIDLSTLTTPGGSDINGWEWTCDASSQFWDATASGPVVKLVPPGTTTRISTSVIHLPNIHGTGIGSNKGVVMCGLMECDIRINDVWSMGGIGVLVDQSSSRGTFNNTIRVGRIILCGNNGFVTVGNTTVFGFQGNLVQLSYLAQCVNGVVIDNTTGNNTSLNIFDIGVSEHHSGVGVLDNSGENIIRVGNTNSNTHGYVLGSGVTHAPKVEGFFSDGVLLNSQKADIKNALTTIGNAAAPAMPGSGVVQRNTFDRPALICISGGTVSAIAIGGIATGLTAGSVVLLPGEALSINYTVAPSWAWFLI